MIKKPKCIPLVVCPNIAINKTGIMAVVWGQQQSDSIYLRTYDTVAKTWGNIETVATGYEAAGTIRNLPDGRVELIAEGDRSELENFRAALMDAGLAGFIRDEQVIWADAENKFRGFEIVR